MLRWITTATLLYCTMALSRVPFPKEGGDSIFKVRGPNQLVEVDAMSPSMLYRLPESKPQSEPALRIDLGSQWVLTTQSSNRSLFGDAEACGARVGYRFCR